MGKMEGQGVYKTAASLAFCPYQHEQQHSNNHNQNNYTQQKTLRDLFLPKTTLSTTKQSQWAAAATPTALARAALALRAPAPATNKLILSPTDLSVPSPASTTMAQHHLGVHHHRLS